MKKNMIISSSLIIVVVASIMAISKLSLGIATMVIAGTVFATALFGGLFALMVFGAKKCAELREKNPDIAMQLDELDRLNEQTWNPYL